MQEIHGHGQRYPVREEENLTTNAFEDISIVFVLGIFPATIFSFDFLLYRSGTEVSVFKDRTEDSSAMQYFQFYGYLSQQQNMMQVYIRTSTYQKAILSNLTDFRDKVVLDVGAGSGILSFFAQQAGAKKVRLVN